MHNCEKALIICGVIFSICIVTAIVGCYLGGCPCEPDDNDRVEHCNYEEEGQFNAYS
jgi:hypothetical protein